MEPSGKHQIRPLFPLVVLNHPWFLEVVNSRKAWRSSQAESGQESVPPRLVLKDPRSLHGSDTFLASQIQRLNKLSCTEIVSYTPMWIQTTAGLTGLAGVAGALEVEEVALYLKQRVKAERQIESYKKKNMLHKGGFNTAKAEESLTPSLFAMV